MKAGYIIVRVCFITIAVGCVIAVFSYLFLDSHQEKMELTDQVRREAPGEFKQLKYGKTHYLIQGNDSSELIVLIHGGGITGMEVWKDNLSFFARKGYRVLAFDLYGRGYTDRPRVKNSPELFTEQMTELLDSLDIHEPFHVVALSMGAMIALDYAQANKGRVKNMVLIDPAATGDYKPSLMLKLPVVSDFLLTIMWYPRAVENQRKEFVNQSLFETYATRLNYFMNFDGYKFTNYSTWLNMLNQNRLEQIKSDMKIPVLLLYGNQDPYFSAGHASRYSSKIPNVQIAEIRNAGHMPHYEKPDEVNTIIYRFLTGAEVK